MANNLGGIYSTGTVAVAANGTIITGTGTLWTTAAEQGDWFYANGNIGIITDVITNTQLNLELPWTGGLLSGAAYRLIKMSWLRYESAITQQKVREFITRIGTAGLFLNVVGASPDPGDGVEGLWALKANVVPWKAWLYTSGAWVLQADIAAGINPTGAWSSVTAYAKNDSVSLNGSSYVCKLANTNQSPPNATYWQVLASIGNTGTVGLSTGLLVTYSNTTTDADPGAGIFRLNNATPASATAAYIDNTQVGGGTISGLMDLWDDSTNTIKGILRCQKATDATVWAQWQVTGSIVDGTGYRKVTLANGAGSGAFTNTDQFVFTFERAGNVGADAPISSGTSTTSLAIGTGTKVFTTQAGKSWLNGVRIRAVSAANAANWMEGVCTYSGTTLTMTSSKTGGSGTLADWNLNITGEPGTGDLLSTNNLSDLNNSATARANLGIIMSPMGRLTLATATPVMVSNQAAKTTIYYTPDGGNQIPIYNGTLMTMTVFAELSVLTTDTTKNPAAIGASKVNDWFVWNDSGTMRLSHGPDWTSDTARSAGTALVLVNGIYLNSVSITNGPAASRGTYVGTTRSNASSQLDWIIGGSASGGVAGFLWVWNMYNRRRAIAQTIDNGSAYTYSSATVRQARGDTDNQINFVVGIQEDTVTAILNYRGQTAAVSGAGFGVGIGIDVTNTYAVAQDVFGNQAGNAISTGGTKSVEVQPTPGVHFIASIENSDGANANTFNHGTNNGLSVSIPM